MLVFYIFTVAALPPDKVVVIETHKITASLGGNGNEIIVEPSLVFNVSQWIMKRLDESGLKKNSTHHSSLLLRKGRYL